MIRYCRKEDNFQKTIKYTISLCASLRHCASALKKEPAQLPNLGLVQVEQWNGIRPLFFLRLSTLDFDYTYNYYIELQLLPTFDFNSQLRLIPTFCYALCIIALIGSVVI